MARRRLHQYLPRRWQPLLPKALQPTLDELLADPQAGLARQLQAVAASAESAAASDRRTRARAVLTGCASLMRQLLTEQRELFGQTRAEKSAACEQLAVNLIASRWTPPGAQTADVALVGERLLADILYRLAEGQPYDRLQRGVEHALAAPQASVAADTLPALSTLRRSRRGSGYASAYERPLAHRVP